MHGTCTFCPSACFSTLDKTIHCRFIKLLVFMASRSRRGMESNQLKELASPDTARIAQCYFPCGIGPTLHFTRYVLFSVEVDRVADLVQQQLYKLANGIAGLFPDPNERVLYQQAAATFRVPYWDWSIMAPEGQTHLPEPLWSPLIAQYGPNGIQNIKNPLHSYVFHPLDVAELIWDPVSFE